MLQATVKSIKNPTLQRLLLRALYKKNHLRLKSFRNYNNRFFVYEVNGKYIPSESVNWYTSYDYLASHANNISLLKYKPRNGDIVVDVGAGLGEEAIILSDLVGGAGRVYSVEANPAVFAILKEIISLNKLQNVLPLNLAVNIEDKPVKIVDIDESYMTGFVGGKEGSPSTEVEGLRFDSFMNKYNLDRIDLLKCNIEGAERFLIDSISKDHLSKIRNVAIACHDFRYSETQNDFFLTKEHVKQFLSDNLFEIETQHSGIDYQDDWVYGRNYSSYLE